MDPIYQEPWFQQNPGHLPVNHNAYAAPEAAEGPDCPSPEGRKRQPLCSLLYLRSSDAVQRGAMSDAPQSLSQPKSWPRSGHSCSSLQRSCSSAVTCWTSQW